MPFINRTFFIFTVLLDDMKMTRNEQLPLIEMIIYHDAVCKNIRLKENHRKYYFLL